VQGATGNTTAAECERQVGRTLGEELRSARLHAGGTQEGLAHRAAVDRSSISQPEHGLKSPTVDMLLRLCRAMGASAPQIVARAQQAQRPP
jgi:transcriptional regulator with XRE-family HTH domain